MNQRPTPIKVLRVIARMNVGGPALQVVALSEGLSPPAYDHRLLVGEVEPGEGDYLVLRAPHVHATRIRGLGRSVKLLDDVRALLQLVREVRRFRPDIVHTHTAKAGVLGRIAAIVCRTPVIVHTFHGHLLHGYFSERKTRLVIAVERTLARRTTCLVAVGERVRDDLINAGVGTREQYVVVPPGVDFAVRPTRSEARAALGLPEDAHVVAFVARLTAVKRPDRFIAAAFKITDRLPDTMFVIAGEGELLAEMQSEATGLGDRMRFLGWRPDVEVVYAAADVVMLTSDNEGMPVSLIEAQALGCPAVTTDVGSAREVVANGDTGLVVEADPAALADAACSLLSDPARRRAMGDAASDRARAHFGRGRLIADTARIYGDLLASADQR